jgi:tryptophan synthase alpha chain
LNPIGKVFRSLDGEGALITYVMGGDPDVETTEKVVDALIAGGADIIELGIPFSDPIADGRSIQEAAVRSLSSGTRPSDVLSVVTRIKEKHRTPIAIMTYYNILYSPGLEKFLTQAKEAGVDGIIVPDLPLDETEDYSRLAKKQGLDTILLAAPTTSTQRMKSLVKHSTGFLYLVSLLGVTGARSQLGDETVNLVKSAKSQTRRKIPLGVGFGVSKPEHVRALIGAGADAVIVGSSIVNMVASGKNSDAMLRDVENYVRSLKTATKTHRGNQI